MDLLKGRMILQRAWIQDLVRRCPSLPETAFLRIFSFLNMNSDI